MLSFRASLAFLSHRCSCGSVGLRHSHTQEVFEPTRAHGTLLRAWQEDEFQIPQRSKKSRRTKLRGQQGIDTARATEIQHALIREHYLSGEPTGLWDSATVSAMQKYQADQGWQTRLTPDSRAIKKLGLGPDYSNAINANGSSFAGPGPAAEIPAPQASGFAAASGVNP